MANATEGYANDITTTLSGNGGSISAAATTFNVASTTGWPTAGTRIRIRIDNEIMIVNNYTGTALSSITRAAEAVSGAQAATTHQDGAVVSLVGPTAGVMTNLGTPYINVKAAPYNAKGDGVTDDTNAIKAAISDAVSGAANVYIPAGTYAVTPPGGSNWSIFTISAANVEIFGDGRGQTIIQLPNNVAATGSNNYVFFFNNIYAEIHHMSIYGGTGWSGTGNVGGVQFDTGAFYPHAHHLEVNNIYGGSGAGGTGIGLYTAWNQTEFTSTLGTATSPVGYNVPAQPSLSTASTGGSLVPGNYHVVITYTGTNGETAGSVSQGITIPAGTSTNTIVVANPGAATGQTGYYVYATPADTGGPRTYYRQQAAGSPTTIGSAYTISSVGTTGANPPVGFTPPTPVPTTVATGGTVAAGIYGVIVSYTNAAGETVGSAAGSITTTGTTSTITVPSPPSAPNATGWYAYVTQAGGSIYTRQQAAGSPTALGTGLTITAPPTNTGANPSTTNTAGTYTAIPGTMTGIYPGRKVTVGGTNPETVVCASVTATTFTAVFNSVHLSTDAITMSSEGRQYGLVEYCQFKSGHQMVAIGAGCNACTIRENVIIAVGGTSLQHGMYMQGGGHVIEKNYVEGCSGFGIHCHNAAPYLDNSGTRVVNNEVINCGLGGIVSDTYSQTTDDGNLEEAAGTADNRSSLIHGNYVKNLKNGGMLYGIQVANKTTNAPFDVTISNNILEDAGTTGNGYINVDLSGLGHVTISDNTLRQLNPTGNVTGIITSNGQANITIKGNRFFNWTGIAVNSGSRMVIEGNSFDMVSGQAISGTLQYTTILGNLFTLAGSAVGIGNIFSAINLSIVFNQFYGTASYGIQLDNTHTSMTVANNHSNGPALRYDVGSAGFVIANNHMPVSMGGFSATTTQTERVGPLTYAMKDTSNIPDSGYLLKFSASGQWTLCTTSDTVFHGLSLSASSSGSTVWYAAGQPGAEVQGAQTDGTWTAGHYGIPSTTSAAKIHDTGSTTPPASGSYILFLDSGTGSGIARVLVCKTFA